MINFKSEAMAKSIKSGKNQQLEMMGFIFGAMLSIPAIIMAGFGIYKLLKAISAF